MFRHVLPILLLSLTSTSSAQQRQHYTTGPSKPTPTYGCRAGCRVCGGLTCWEWCPPQLPVAECYRDDPDRPCLLCYRAGGNSCGAVYLGGDGQEDDGGFCRSCARDCVCVIGGICLDDDDGGGGDGSEITATPTPTPAPTFLGHRNPAGLFPGAAEPRDAFNGRGVV